VRARTRVNTRVIVARPSVICSSIRHRDDTLARALENEESSEEPRGRELMLHGPAARWWGRFITVAFTREATDVNALVFIARGERERETGGGEGVETRRREHVRVRERVRVRAHIRMTPRRVGSLPTVRGVHHPRLTGGTRPLCAL